jgi:lysophospholipase L1-like esterase
MGRWLGILGLATIFAAPLTGAAAEISIRSRDRIAFLGDSITAGGWVNPYGYVRLVLQALEQEGVIATPIPAGVAGDTSERMRNRIDGVLAKKPTWLTLSCGFNDVSPACGWQVGFEDFKKHVTTILDKSQAAGVKVIILTPTLYNDTDPDNATNQKAAPYVEHLRQTAKERGLPLADLNAAHRAEMARLKSENSLRKTLLCDGIHMAPRGDMMMANGVLKTMGFTDEQIAKAREKWLDAAYRHPIVVWRDMTVRQFEKAKAFAAREKMDSVKTALESFWERALTTAAKTVPTGTDMKAIWKAAQIQYGKDLDALLEGDVTMAEEKSPDAPYRTSVLVYREMTVRQFEKAEAFTAREKETYVSNVLEPLWIRALVSAAKAAPAEADMKAIREAAQIQYGKDLDTLLESGLTIKELKQ